MVLKKNKKAWLRILESFIGIILISGVLIFVVSNQQETEFDASYINNLQSSILEEISLNESLRIAVLSNNLEKVNNSINKKIPNNFDFDLKICELNEEVGCKIDYIQREIYKKEKIIASNLTIYSPKKVRLFIWVK